MVNTVDTDVQKAMTARPRPKFIACGELFATIGQNHPALVERQANPTISRG
jgi:hypothetical protein